MIEIRSVVRAPSRAARRLGYQSRILLVWSDEDGAVAFTFALIATLVIAVLGLGIDVGAWHRIDRNLQNAADASAVAAARNGTSSYQSEATAVAAQYGLIDGTSGVTVTALNNQACPNGQINCFSVTVAMTAAPQFFSQVVAASRRRPCRAPRWLAAGRPTLIACLPSPAAAPIRRSQQMARRRPISAAAA